ncbi:MAG TPA: DUF1579 domain-containing protein [Candidatus Polarisedimenticolaceae bacterium]|nr:DUF1579 domain-containing protein [Candidatus Polarisedimenticolaceae bacterium]
MNRKFVWIALAAVVLAVAAPVFADDMKKPDMSADEQAMMEAYMKAAEPGDAHKKMAAEVGTYDMKVTSWGAPGAPPSEDKGTATRKMIMDGRVLVEDVTSSMMGMPFKGQGMRGYDNVTGKYWGTWVDSFSTGVMISEGTCDDAKGTCSFTGTMNDPVTKKANTVRMTVRMQDPKTEIFEMYAPGPDGKEMKMMEIAYTKKS